MSTQTFDVKVQIKLDDKKLQDKYISATDYGVEKLAEQVHTDCAELVPLQEGGLRKSYELTKERDCERLLSWNTIYALYQYYGCWPDGSHRINDNNRYTNGTKSMWYDDAKAHCADNWKNVFNAAFQARWSE